MSLWPTKGPWQKSELYRKSSRERRWVHGYGWPQQGAWDYSFKRQCGQIRAVSLDWMSCECLQQFSCVRPQALQESVIRFVTCSLDSHTWGLLFGAHHFHLWSRKTGNNKFESDFSQNFIGIYRERRHLLPKWPQSNFWFSSEFLYPYRQTTELELYCIFFFFFVNSCLFPTIPRRSKAKESQRHSNSWRAGTASDTSAFHVLLVPHLNLRSQFTF